MATGRTIKTRDALALGLIDQVAEGDLRHAGIAFCEAWRHGKRHLASVPVAEFDPDEFARMAAALRKRAKGKTSVERVIEVVALAARLPFAEALVKERQVFDDLRTGLEARALRHLFFAERKAGKIVKELGGRPRALQRIGVIGSGTMGQGIAAAFALGAQA